MSRSSTLACLLALPLFVNAAQAAPSIATIKKVAKQKIVADAKAWLKQTGFDKALDRPKVKVSFEPVHCGTPPVSIRCLGQVCAMQRNPVPSPGLPNAKRMLPWAHASFDATGALTGKKVSVQRLGDWLVSPPCFLPPPR